MFNLPTVEQDFIVVRVDLKNGKHIYVQPSDVEGIRAKFPNLEVGRPIPAVRLTLKGESVVIPVIPFKIAIDD